jgi:phage terminase small subunit
MLQVIADESADPARRDRMAAAAAPYLHARAIEVGKKDEQASRAKDAAGGSFAPRGTPKLVVSNG